jgi:hypothetical protein
MTTSVISAPKHKSHVLVLWILPWSENFTALIVTCLEDHASMQSSGLTSNMQFFSYVLLLSDIDRHASMKVPTIQKRMRGQHAAHHDAATFYFLLLAAARGIRLPVLGGGEGGGEGGGLSITAPIDSSSVASSSSSSSSATA